MKQNQFLHFTEIDNCMTYKEKRIAYKTKLKDI